MKKDDEDVQDAERDRGSREEVAAGNVGNVIVQKCTPSLRWRLPTFDHVLGHRSRGHNVAEQGQAGHDISSSPTQSSQVSIFSGFRDRLY